MEAQKDLNFQSFKVFTCVSKMNIAAQKIFDSNT